MNGAAGAVILQAILVYVRGPACQVGDEAVTITLIDKQGHQIAAQGNPFVTHVSGRLAANAEDPNNKGAVLAWRNWCQATPMFDFTASSPHVGSQKYDLGGAAPVCQDPHSPSSIRTFTDRG